MTTDDSALRRWFGKTANGRRADARREAVLRRRARLLEALESRVLFAVQTDYILDANTLTTIVNGVAGAPMVVADVNNVQITGDSTLNHIIVQNFAGHATINGSGGGDQITVYAGSGGTVTVHDTAGSALDQLIVRAPTAVQANVTVGLTMVNVGSDVVNYDTTAASLSVIGQLFSSGDTLTVNGSSSGETIGVSGSNIQIGTAGTQPSIFYSTFINLTVNGGGGADTFNLSGDSIPTFLNANGAGSSTFNIGANSVPLTITGSSSGTDQYTITSNSGPLTITGQGATNNFTVNASAATTILNGGTAVNNYTINANSASLTINGGGTQNNVNIVANSSSVTVNGGTGTDSFTVGTTSGSVTLKGGAGANTTYNIAAPTIGPVTVTGNVSGTGALTFHGTTLTDVFSVTSTTLSAGSGALVSYSNLTGITLDGVAGNDTFLVTSIATPTTLMGQAGNDTFNIRADSALVTVNSGGGTNTTNIGSNAPATTSNVLSTLTGGVTVLGSGTDILNINDGADSSPATVGLSTTGLTGLAGGITYSGLSTLNVVLGSGGNTVNVTGSPSGATTSVSLGSGANTATVTSTAPAAGGNINSVLGALTLTGSGADDLIIDDSGSNTVKTGTLTTTTLSGLSTGAITFTGFHTLGLKLGSGGNNLTVNDTLASVTSTITMGTGVDTLLLKAAHGVTNITVSGGASTVSVQTINAATTITTAVSTLVNVGSIEPTAGGVLAGIQAALNVNGNGHVTLEVDDSGDGSAATGTMSGTQITGFGMVAAGISYTGLQTLDLFLGSGGNSVTVSDTPSLAITDVHGNSGADNVVLQHDSGFTFIEGQGGNDTIRVQAIGAMTTVNVGSGTDVVNVGSGVALGSGLLSGIVAALTVQGNSTDTTLNVDDGGDGVAKTGTLSSASITGLSVGAINYTGTTTLNLTLGTLGDHLTIASTGAATNVNSGNGADVITVMTTANVVDIQSGAGDDTVDVRTTGAVLTIESGMGNNIVLVGSNGSLGNGVVGTINGALTLTGGGTDVFSVDDSGNSLATTATLTSTVLSGLNPGDITYSGVSLLSILLGSGADTFNIAGTASGSTLVQSNDGDDTINIQATTGDTTVNTGTGDNTINISSTAPMTGGVLADILGEISVQGSGTDTLNLLDDGNTGTAAGTITGMNVLGLSTGVINFGGVAALNVMLGSGDNTLAVQSTALGMTTTITGGAGTNAINVQATNDVTVLNLTVGDNVVNVGSLAPASGSTLDQINGTLTIHGSGSDEVNLDDSGNAVGKTLTIAAGSVTGASPQAINFDNIGELNVYLGSGVDTATVTDSSAPLLLDTGDGDDQVNVRKTTEDITVQNSAGADTVNIGSLAPASNGVLAQISGMVTVSGGGSDTLNVDDSGDVTGQVGSLDATSLTGLSPAGIMFSGLAHLNVHLGMGDDTLTVSATTSATAVTTGGGTNTINVGPTNLSGITSTLVVSGSGSDILNINDSASAGPSTGLMNATQVLMGAASVTYSGLGNLNLMLAPQTTFTVWASAAGVDTNITSTSGAVTIGGAGAGHLTSGVAGPVAVVGSDATDLIVDDANDAIGQSVTLDGTTVTGIAAGTITYGHLTTLAILGGNGSDTFTVNGTHAQPTTLNTGDGADHADILATGGLLTVTNGSGFDTVLVGSVAPATGGVLSGIGAMLTLNGNGAMGVTLDNSGDTAGVTVTVDKATVSGLNTGGVSYDSLTTLALKLGSATDTVMINSTAAGNAMSIDAGAGNDAVTVVGGDFNGSLSLDGSDDTDSLLVDDSASTGMGTITLTPTTINGLGGQIDYVNFETLALNLGASEGLAVNDISPTTATTISAPSGMAAVSFSGDFTGQLSLGDLSAGSFAVGGDFDGMLSLTGGLQSLTVGGDFNGTATIPGNADNMTIGNDLTGTLAIGGNLGTLAVGNDLSGTVTVGADATTVTVAGDFSGDLEVLGHLGTMTIGGADSGTISANTIDLIGVAKAVAAGTSGTMFSVTQGGVLRSVRGLSSDGTPADSVTATIVYDGSSGSAPQAAVRLSNSKVGHRFDLILDAPANSDGFDLSQVKAVGDRYVGARNIDVTGNLLNAGLTSLQANYFGEFGPRPGGVYLPADTLAAVAVTGNMAFYSILAKSIQAVAFGTVTQKNGAVWRSTHVSHNGEFQDDILTGTLALNPTNNKKPFAKIAKPTEKETLRLTAGTPSHPVGLFIGKNAKHFVGRASYFSDQKIDSDAPVGVEVQYAKKWSPNRPVIVTATFRGDGGSLNTDHLVKNIVSTGALGDVILRAGPMEKLLSLTAPSMFGELKFPDGGKFVGSR